MTKGRQVGRNGFEDDLEHENLEHAILAILSINKYHKRKMRPSFVIGVSVQNHDATCTIVHRRIILHRFHYLCK